jgi:hypothetical protein
LFCGVAFCDVEYIDELSNTWHAVDNNVNHIWAWRSEIHIPGHRGRHNLSRATGTEADGVKIYQAMAHVQRMSDEAAVAQSDFQACGILGAVEADDQIRLSRQIKLRK